MRKITLKDVQMMKGFGALTQEQERIVVQLIERSNEFSSKMKGFIETRRDVLCTEFDREAVKECLELVPVYTKGNEFFRLMMKVLLEKIARDAVEEGMVDDLVENMRFKIKYFNGDIDKVIAHYETYYTCGEVVPLAQTWRERVEELEKGVIIYDKPKFRDAV